MSFKWGYLAVLLAIFAGLLLWMRTVRETYVDLGTQDMPDPQLLMRQMRTLLDKYDKPEIWNHIAAVTGKDPADLARMNLGQTPA